MLSVTEKNKVGWEGGRMLEGKGEGGFFYKVIFELKFEGNEE